MSTETLSLMLVVIPVGALVLTCVLLYPAAKRRKQAMLEDFRARTEVHYRAFRILSSDARFAFDLATATLVKEEEVFAMRRHSPVWDFGVTRYLRNPAGEYFRVTAGPEGVTGFGHVEQRIARIVLKERYEAPVESVGAPRESTLPRTAT